MAQNVGTLVTSAIRANDPLDLIATAYSSEIMGGLHTATSSSDMYNIFDVRREWGMLCYVINDDKTYQLVYNHYDTDITNDLNWTEFKPMGNEWIDSVISILTTQPISPTFSGVRYLVGKQQSDSVTGVDWSAYSSGGGFVAEWDNGIGEWVYTNPTNNMSVRVDDEDNAIYRYEGIWNTGTWQKEKESQVRYIYATTSNNRDYIATSTPIFDYYEQDTIYIVKFAAVNSGTYSTLDINGIGQVIIKKTDGTNLSNLVTNDLTTNYQYILTYDGTYFELYDTTGGSGLNIKYHILSGETIIVPTNTEYWVYGDLTIDGTLENNGYVIVANGSLTASGTFSNFGSYSNIYFAEINGLGVNNYVPHWIAPYMLTATSSIYDDYETVDITSVTFSINSNIVIPNGASQGFVLTSDSVGNATWVTNTGNKFAGTYSFNDGVTYSIPHNLNSENIIINVWDEDTGQLILGPGVIYRTSLNNVDISVSTSPDPSINVRVVIIS